ncbi:HIT family protein [Curtobacterium sp. MCBA15_001]|uniref:HIT family protein n=1 Tax=Curtobacterium sp. MCBA15_001 TaxID=1898731 RepID=UPI0008DD58C5|nr:diadenosine tetraphosphate hydrolase [Curtobacterium sp. MCBA15_001]OIH93746.1 diadenosine tetraphosphate hydrolase [Curtobacterium sp. MCBA15_001]
MDWRRDRIAAAHRGENPTVLAELAGGFAVIGDVQFLPGYCVLLGKDPRASSLADMPRAARVQFLADADLLATAVERACRSSDPAFRRVNLEVLGNTDPLVHAHVWPRYAWEPPSLVTRPVWLYDADRWHDPANALGARHDVLRERITSELLVLADGDAVVITSAP